MLRVSTFWSFTEVSVAGPGGPPGAGAGRLQRMQRLSYGKLIWILVVLGFLT